MKKLKSYLKVLFCQTVITGLMIVVLSYVFYSLKCKDNILNIGIMAIYAISNLVGGIIISKMEKEKKILMCMITGGMYYLMLIIISFVISENPLSDGVDCILTGSICIISAAFPGILSKE